MTSYTRTTYAYRSSPTPPTASAVPPTATMPARTRAVSFSPEPLYSRQPYDDEVYVMKAFARHAARCAQCSNPYQVHKAGATLCAKGHRRARDVAQYVYAQAGLAYSQVDREGTRQQVQLEIPVGCEAVRSLLRAMERGLRLQRQADAGATAAAKIPESLDRTYYVAPRLQRTRTDPVDARRSAAERSERRAAADTPAPRAERRRSERSASPPEDPAQPRRHRHHHHASASRRTSTEEMHAASWPRRNRASTYDYAARPAPPYYYDSGYGYTSFPAYDAPRAGLVSVW